MNENKKCRPGAHITSRPIEVNVIHNFPQGEIQINCIPQSEPILCFCMTQTLHDMMRIPAWKAAMAEKGDYRDEEEYEPCEGECPFCWPNGSPGGHAAQTKHCTKDHHESPSRRAISPAGEFVKVTADEFKKFLQEYPRKLEHDCCAISEPPLHSYNDFTGGLVWPESMVAKFLPINATDRAYGITPAREDEFYIRVIK